MTTADHYWLQGRCLHRWQAAHQSRSGRRLDHGGQRSRRRCAVAERITDVGLQDLARDGSDEPLMAIAAAHPNPSKPRRSADTLSTSGITRVMPRRARTCGIFGRCLSPMLPATVPREPVAARKFSGACLSAWAGTDRRCRLYPPRRSRIFSARVAALANGGSYCVSYFRFWQRRHRNSAPP